MGTISISETPLVTLTGTYEWLWTTSQWKIEADTVHPPGGLFTVDLINELLGHSQ